MRALLVSVKYRVPRCQPISSATRPSLCQDPWLCVTRLLWFCPFGERFDFLLYRRLPRVLEKKMTCTLKKRERSYLPKIRALLESVKSRVPRCISHLFGNPAILMSGPVALRHQITLALPVRRTFFSSLVALLSNAPDNSNNFLLAEKNFFSQSHFQENVYSWHTCQCDAGVLRER